MPLPGFLAGWGLSPHLREQPLRDRDAALALLPEWMRESDSVARDAIADACVVAFNRQASALAAHATSSSPQFATGSRLDLVGSHLPRAVGEDDEEYRARLIEADEMPTPRSILAAIDRILAPITTAQAYYVERPNDDAFLHTKDPGTTTGCYLGTAPAPMVHPGRAYDERTRCKPRHIILWRCRRNATTASVTSSSVIGSFSTRVDGNDDQTAPDNGHGHVIIGLPATLQPGRSLPGDTSIYRTPDPPLTDGSGALTETVRPTAAAMGSIFSLATMATRALANMPTGIAVYRASEQPEIVVGKIRSMLASRGMSPTQYTLLFDPSVTEAA